MKLSPVSPDLMPIVIVTVLATIAIMVTSHREDDARDQLVSQLTCATELYSEVNYRTSRCMILDNKTHDACFVQVAVELCAWNDK